jgi:membrane fusion protein, multidrug efflux system
MKWALVAFVAAIALAPACFAQEEEPEQSVLVTVVKPEQGSMPDTRVVYGVAEALTSGTMDLTIAHAGRVGAIHIYPGEWVHKDDPLLDFGADPAAVAEWNKATSELELAKEERARTQQLVAQQLATRTVLAQAEKALTDAQAAVDIMKREGGNQIQETLRAPFEGYVTNVAVSLGARVAEKAPLVTIARADSLVVTIGIEPRERTIIQRGQSATLEPLDGGPTIEGKVSVVTSMIDPKSRQIEAVIKTPPGSIVAGENFRVTITVGKFDGWLVPRSAVLSDDQGTYIFQVSGEKAVRIGVKIVGQSGDTTVVDGPIEPERKLVTIGSYQLADGMKVHEDEEAQ